MGIFIGLEGIDGCGKTTVIQPLVLKLRSIGIDAIVIDKKKCDYDNVDISKYARTIRDLIWFDYDDPRQFVTNQGWLYMHSLWYSILVENGINPLLKKHDVLIVDGWYYKNCTKATKLIYI